MTANQVYKLSGSTTPFAEWIGEQKTKYGEKFITAINKYVKENDW